MAAKANSKPAKKAGTKTLAERTTAARARQLRGGYDKFDKIFASRFRDIRIGFARALDGLLTREGITYGQWRCLRVLCDNDGISQRELAGFLDMSSAAVVFAVNLLERDGIAKRVPDPSDKRRIFVTLTKEGYRLESVLLAESRKISERIFQFLSDAEVVALDRLISKVRLGQLAEIERQAAQSP
jgi:DNA-binding MarR family transcriptional regulator